MLAGRVTVNNQIITTRGVKADPTRDTILLDGVPLAGPGAPVILKMNKPINVVTTLDDPQGRPTVADLVADFGRRVYPIGRLDFDTEGLLLLTNDGELAHRIQHPSFQAPKVYKVKVEGRVGDETLDRLRQGVEIDGRMTAPALVDLLKVYQDRSWLEITLIEGRNRQIKLMCELVGHPALRIKRTSVGPIKLGSLKPGQYQRLTFAETVGLKKLVGLVTRDRDSGPPPRHHRS
ncbi:MAG: rRNA pseudouridine synthase [Deltaproteobacteria bacterium]|nr:rRNA pseudouridine synthase [Deltaproteobacteria bacterium]